MDDISTVRVQAAEAAAGLDSLQASVQSPWGQQRTSELATELDAIRAAIGGWDPSESASRHEAIQERLTSLREKIDEVQRYEVARSAAIEAELRARPAARQARQRRQRVSRRVVVVVLAAGAVLIGVIAGNYEQDSEQPPAATFNDPCPEPSVGERLIGRFMVGDERYREAEQFRADGCHDYLREINRQQQESEYNRLILEEEGPVDE